MHILFKGRNDYEIGDGKIDRFVEASFREYKMVLFSPVNPAFLKMLCSEMVVAAAAVSGEKVEFSERIEDMGLKVFDDPLDTPKLKRIVDVSLKIAERIGVDKNRFYLEMKKWFTKGEGKLVYKGEKWAGGGYPYGLKGTEIPEEARIFAVAEAFCTLCDKYDNTRSLMFVKQQAGKSFDPKVVDVLEKMVYEGEV